MGEAEADADAEAERKDNINTSLPQRNNGDDLAGLDGRKQSLEDDPQPSGGWRDERQKGLSIAFRIDAVGGGESPRRCPWRQMRTTTTAINVVGRGENARQSDR